MGPLGAEETWLDDLPRRKVGESIFCHWGLLFDELLDDNVDILISLI